MSAQVRSSTALVRPILTEEGRSAYLQMASAFEGVRDAERIVERLQSMAKGESFGSGFLTTDAAGRPIVVTNRHVVGFSERVNVTLGAGAQGEEKFAGCRVILKDDDIDLAVILLPPGAVPAAPPLEVTDEALKQGGEVWAAGFPGRSDTPTWRLSKGSVTDTSVIVEELGRPESAIFIQHTAPIDPGSSGGPLLVGDPSDETSLRVCGVNTWMTRASSYAIPAPVFRAAVTAIPGSAETRETLDEVTDRARAFAATLNQEAWSRFDAERWISYSFAASQGWAVFERAMQDDVKVKEREDWYTRLLSGSPAETLREVLSFKIYRALHSRSSDWDLSYLQSLSDGGKSLFRTGFRSGKREVFADWVLDAGRWRIASAGIPEAGLQGPMSETDAVHPVKEERPRWTGNPPMPAGFHVGAGVGTVPTQYGWGGPDFFVHAGWDFPLSNWARLGPTAAFAQAASLVQGSLQSTLTLVGLGAQIRAGLPVPVAAVTLVPYVSARLKVNFALNAAGPEAMAFVFSASPGVGVQIATSAHFALGLELAPELMLDAFPPRLAAFPLVLTVSF
jgi:serine protease Do